MPEVPRMVTEEELLEKFVPFIDELSLAELWASLRAASQVFDQVAGRRILEEDDTQKHLLIAKRRLHRARIWLSLVADNHRVNSLCTHKGSSPGIGISAGVCGVETEQHILN